MWYTVEPGMAIVRVLPTAIAVFAKADDRFLAKYPDVENETPHLRGMTE